MKSKLALNTLSLLLALGLAPTSIWAATKVGTLETVVELPIRPGNVAATVDGQVFATVHPLDKPSGMQLIKITGPSSYVPWPSAALQSNESNRSDERIDTPLGIARDAKGRLWIVDMGLNLGKARLWAFDIATGKVDKKIELPANVAPKGSFIQDLAVDDQRGWVYLADIAPPALLAVNIETGTVHRFEGHPSLQAEPQAKLHVGSKPTFFGGKPAKVGVDPITLSKDGETLFFGAMNGTRWYSIPSKLLREVTSDAERAAGIKLVGRKPLSDGAATDDDGNHFFTNLNDNGIDWMDRRGRLKSLVRDKRLQWPDSVQFGPEAWLYISVNQLHTTTAFTGGKDLGKPPYRIMRAWTGTSGQRNP
ncbi:L-dopachrome tautomerase-related protein [Undibacterium curvum]|uniref:L-dopachrome tautomerase-related protein n=1 Tax=Undibacterium curvum TaxID=2762294 RepID=UPI003D0CC50A